MHLKKITPYIPASLKSSTESSFITANKYIPFELTEIWRRQTKAWQSVKIAKLNTVNNALHLKIEIKQEHLNKILLLLTSCKGFDSTYIPHMIYKYI